MLLNTEAASDTLWHRVPGEVEERSSGQTQPLSSRSGPDVGAGSVEPAKHSEEPWQGVGTKQLQSDFCFKIWLLLPYDDMRRQESNRTALRLGAIQE